MIRPFSTESFHPQTLTSTLIGRDDELSAVTSRLDRGNVRLVTLTGPGGIGKTRIALRLIETVGAAFVDLAAARGKVLSPQALLTRLSHRLNFLTGGHRDALARLLGAAQALREEVGIPVEPALRQSYQRTAAALRTAPGEEGFTAALATERAMSRKEAITAALQTPVTEPAPPLAPMPSPSTRPPGEPLTAREFEVLRLLADGLSTREIADRLFISHRTVSTHTTKLLGKLRVDTRAAAIAVAHRTGMI